MSSPTGRGAGFTLLEVLLAIVIFAISMGALISWFQGTLVRVNRARLASRGSHLAEEQIRSLLADSLDEDLLDEGHDEGIYEPPDDTLRWELAVEPYGIPLDEAFSDQAGSSSIFQVEQEMPGAELPSLHRVTLHVFSGDTDEDLIDPFVVFVTEPLEAAETGVEGNPPPGGPSR